MKTYCLKSVFNYLFLFLVLTLAISCSKAERMKDRIAIEEVSVNESYNSVSNKQENQLTTTSVDRKKILNQLKIIKSADVKYKVKSVKKHTRLIKNLVPHYNAYISDLRFENNAYKKENRFIIKIPSEYFDTLLDSISNNVDFIDYENITTEDVSEEYVDLQTRLKTKQEVKQRYEFILRKKATTIKDILLTEEKLRIIQEEIEAAKGRLNYISNKVSFSTIAVNLYETVDYKEEPVTYKKTFGTKTKEGLDFGWTIIENIFLFIIYVWPFIIIGGILLFIFRKRFQKK